MLKVVEKQDTREASEGLLPLDEIAREGARWMLIEALKAEADDYVRAIAASGTSRDVRWWCATAGARGASLPWAREPWSLRRRGSTIAGAMSREGAGASLAASCRVTCG